MTLIIVQKVLYNLSFFQSISSVFHTLNFQDNESGQTILISIVLPITDRMECIGFTFAFVLQFSFLKQLFFRQIPRRLMSTKVVLKS